MAHKVIYQDCDVSIKAVDPQIDYGSTVYIENKTDEAIVIDFDDTLGIEPITIDANSHYYVQRSVSGEDILRALEQDRFTFGRPVSLVDSISNGIYRKEGEKSNYEKLKEKVKRSTPPGGGASGDSEMQDEYTYKSSKKDDYGLGG